MIPPMIQQITNAARSAATIVEPTGVPAKIETMIPNAAQMTESTEEDIITLRKLLKRRIEESAGKMMSAVMSNEPTKYMERTMITAITMARNN